MKKVGIITFQDADNYGAMLQCYALQHYLKSMGYDAKTINYKCEYFAHPYGIAALRRKGIIRYVLGNINALVRKFRKKRFSDFRNIIDMTRPVSKENICTLNNEFDLFISGSDCVWSYDLTNFDTTYFLDFVDKKEKKGSYAASFGTADIPEEYKEKYSKLLSDYKYFNVREQSGANLVCSFTQKNANVVLDPTLLLSMEQWNEVCSDRLIKEKYIFVYQLALSKGMINVINKIAKETNYKVVFIPFPLGGLIKAKSCLSYGPKEWVTLIRDAEYVITDSFHGTAFSIIFKKQFFSYLNEGRTRIENLLSKTGLERRLIDDTTNISEILSDTIDYQDVEKRLEQERNYSKTILVEMVNDA